MRVALLVSSDHLGGGEGHALWLARSLPSRSIEVRLAARGGGPLQRDAIRRDLKLATVVPGDGPDLPGFARLLGWLREQQVDLVHAHLNRGALFGSLAARLVKVPCVVTAHGINRPVYYRFADRIIAVSAAARDHLVSRSPDLADRIRIIPNTLDPAFAPDPGRADLLRKELAFGTDERLLLIVGRLHPNKGQRLAIEIAARLGAGHRLVLAGEGPDRPELERLARRCPTANVTFLGQRPDVADLMGAVDLVLVPSAHEAFSVAAAEALLCGVPVVATRSGGLVELIGDDGYLVEGPETEPWVSTCRSVMADRTFARARASRARERLVKEHDPEKVLAGIVAVYEEVTRVPSL